MEPVTLETDRLLLRAFTAADVDAVYEACQDEDIQFYTPVPVPYRRADAEQLVGEKLPAQWASDKDYTLGAFRKDTGGLVGSYCWAALDVHRVEWWAMVGNTGSRAVAEKLGFTVEGTLRNRSIANDGRPHDWWVGGLLSP
ncbi:GNAT family protein [Streptomyces sp. NPDC047014]|uniref:GNAT family N-acetyltransferase n=1 Tax=Streptomyces sp. NPDC047014 TaxID=3155736 RepID=UPI003401CC55